MKMRFGIRDQSNISFAYDIGQHKFLFISSELSELLKKDAESLTRAGIPDIIHPEDLDAVQRDYEAFIAGKYNGSTEFRVVINNRDKWLRLTPFCISVDETVTFLGHIFDITPQIDSMDAIRKYTNKKNSVLHILSHDLRGPLGLANSMLAELNMESSDDRLVKLSSAIRTILEQSIDLITHMTNREFLDAISAELIKTRADIAIKIKHYIEECELSARIAQRKFSFKSSKPSIFADIDEAKFMQVLNNLMANALKFTRAGGNISVEVEEQEDHVLIRFSDDGIGIPEAQHPEIFKEFTKAGRTGLKGEPTIGLGLSIVKAIIDWHHGKIWFDSAENSGTTFFIQLPKIAHEPGSIGS